MNITRLKFHLFAAAAIALGVVTPMEAGQAGTQIAIFGAGSSSCAAWTRNHFNTDDRREQVSWVLGYVSGRSETPERQNAIRRTTGYSITGWVDNYCDQHPGEILVGVAEKLLNEFDKTQAN